MDAWHTESLAVALSLSFLHLSMHGILHVCVNCVCYAYVVLLYLDISHTFKTNCIVVKQRLVNPLNTMQASNLF